MEHVPVFVDEISYAGGACPYQVEGKTSDGKCFYLRYRHGRLSAEVFSPMLYPPSEARVGKIVDVRFGGEDGYASPEFFFHLNGLVVFPHDFEIDGIYPRRFLVLKNERRTG